MEQVESLTGRFARLHPRRRLDQSLQQLDDYGSSLSRCLKAGVRQRQLKCENLAGRLARIHPEQALKLRRERLNQLQKRLNSLGPEQVLARGYAIARDEKSGKVLRDAMETGAGQRIRVRLHRGEVAGRVEK